MSALIASSRILAWPPILSGPSPGVLVSQGRTIGGAVVEVEVEGLTVIGVVEVEEVVTVVEVTAVVTVVGTGRAVVAPPLV